MLECVSMHLHVWVYTLCTPPHSHLSSHPVYAYTYIHVSPPSLFLYVLYICIYVLMHFRLYVILLLCCSVIAFYFVGDYCVTFAVSCHVHICPCEFLFWWTYSSNCRLSNHFSSFLKYFNYVSKCQVYAMMWHACFQ